MLEHTADTEIIGRRIGLPNTHLRRYGRGEARDLLLHHAFRVLDMRYHQMVPGQRMADRLKDAWKRNARLWRLWPVNRLASNHVVIAQRRASM